MDGCIHAVSSLFKLVSNAPAMSLCPIALDANCVITTQNLEHCLHQYMQPTVLKSSNSCCYFRRTDT